MNPADLIDRFLRPDDKQYECLRKDCDNAAAPLSFWCRPACNPFYKSEVEFELQAAISDREFYQ
jgi:hypothetical protein